MESNLSGTLPPLSAYGGGMTIGNTPGPSALLTRRSSQNGVTTHGLHLPLDAILTQNPPHSLSPASAPAHMQMTRAILLPSFPNGSATMLPALPSLDSFTLGLGGSVRDSESAMITPRQERLHSILGSGPATVAAIPSLSSGGGSTPGIGLGSGGGGEDVFASFFSHPHGHSNGAGTIDHLHGHGHSHGHAGHGGPYHESDHGFSSLLTTNGLQHTLYPSPSTQTHW